MTDLRTAAQQALEAMRRAVPTGEITLYAWGKAMAELEAALVEDALQKFSDVNQELEAALAEPQPLYGWLFRRNADGTVGIFAPQPRPGESQRTSDCVGPGQRDLHELLGKLADHMAALAEPVQEPVQDGKCKHCVDGCPACDARKLPVQEPVAWIDDSGHPKHLSHLQSATERRLYGPLRPLYTAPPQRKPLTREEAIALWADKSDGPSNGEIVSFARAIERAHGIGGAA